MARAAGARTIGRYLCEPHPKVACNSATRTLRHAHKRCNCNDHHSKSERLTGKLHATLLGNHTRCHTAEGSPPVREAPGLNPIGGATPVTKHCTPYEALHPLRSTAPVTKHCTRYEALHPIRTGAMPTDGVHRPFSNKHKRGAAARIQPHREDSTRSEGVEASRSGVTPLDNKHERGSVHTYP